MAYRMSFKWLKAFMPRSLYGRAALILILPVITIQLAVSIVFIQRHFEGVTEQMTQTMVQELQLLLDAVDDAADAQGLAQVQRDIAAPLALAFDDAAGHPPAASVWWWYDFSGRVVAQTLRVSFPEMGPVILTHDREVELWFDTRHGPLRITFARARVSASNPHQLLVWMVVLGAFMTVIAYLYLRNQLRPIKRLAAAASEYGRGRIVTYNPSGATEVRAAGHAFLDMRNRIERQTQTRTMMLSGVSHDLRTPLTRLRLGLGLFDDDEAEPLQRDVEEMQRMLDGFLDFARGEAETETVLVDPVLLARDVLSDAARAGQAVVAGVLEADGMVPLRPVAVRRALENLISNALRYGAQARLSVHVMPRTVRFVVEDDGPGIPEQQREEALRPFTRLDPARNQDRGSGVGLGLAIVEDIARSHGGALRLGESEVLGGLKAELVLGR